MCSSISSRNCHTQSASASVKADRFSTISSHDVAAFSTCDGGDPDAIGYRNQDRRERSNGKLERGAAAVSLRRML